MRIKKLFKKQNKHWCIAWKYDYGFPEKSIHIMLSRCLDFGSSSQKWREVNHTSRIYKFCHPWWKGRQGWGTGITRRADKRTRNRSEYELLRICSLISLCLLLHNHLFPIYGEWIVQLEWELGCVLIWSWKNKLPAILECWRVGFFSIMACLEALNHICRHLCRSIWGSGMYI